MPLRLRYHPTPAGVSERPGVRCLMVLHRMRIWDQHGRPAGRGQFCHSRGAGATDCQMRPGEPLRNIIEKATQVRGDAVSPITLGHGSKVLGAYLLADS